MLLKKDLKKTRKNILKGLLIPLLFFGLQSNADSENTNSEIVLDLFSEDTRILVADQNTESSREILVVKEVKLKVGNSIDNRFNFYKCFLDMDSKKARNCQLVGKDIYSSIRDRIPVDERSTLEFAVPTVAGAAIGCAGGLFLSYKFRSPQARLPHHIACIAVGGNLGVLGGLSPYLVNYRANIHKLHESFDKTQLSQDLKNELTKADESRGYYNYKRLYFVRSIDNKVDEINNLQLEINEYLESNK